MARHLFRPRLGLVLSAREAREALEALEHGGGRISVNIGLAEVEVEVDRDELLLPMGIRVSRSLLEKMTGDERGTYLLTPRGAFKLEIRAEHYYKLSLFEGCRSPTVEIDGIHMHRVEGIDPWEDAASKIAAIRIKRGMRVLDICTGLGYTAINARLAGASYVLTIEKDPNVLALAEANPWSRRLADPQIEIQVADAVRFVKLLADEEFDAIVHDPPRLSPRTGELYGIKFYRELYRVLKPGGVLYHYTGAPGSRARGLDIVRGVCRRLREVGFDARPARHLMGVIAYKE